MRATVRFCVCRWPTKWPTKVLAVMVRNLLLYEDRWVISMGELTVEKRPDDGIETE
jgi:hypothetical protein